MNIRIREATAADLPAMLAIYNEVIANTTAIYDYTPRTIEAQAAWLDTKRAQNWPVLVADDDGAVAGYGSYGPFRPWPAYLHSVENSIYVAANRRGRGIGSMLLPAIIDHAARRGFHTMIAGIDAANEGSLRLHGKFGFRKVAQFQEVGWKFDRWLDLVFLQRMLNNAAPKFAWHD
ncbi:MAG TPA: GNAT family N-acetyltransferase [Dongiaceae bacterium]|nr:GNAT family N-acetyltransferase [Dongiaceae bacterium]